MGGSGACLRLGVSLNHDLNHKNIHLGHHDLKPLNVEAPQRINKTDWFDQFLVESLT